MSENRLKKSGQFFQVRKKDIAEKKSLSKPIILADSKGKYIQRAITTEASLGIQFCSEGGWKVQQVIDWAEKKLGGICRRHKQVTIYIWLGTCDLTDLNKSSKYISLNSTNDSNVRYIRRKFIELQNFITTTIPKSTVIFLEVPPFSIQWWNKNKGHKEPEIFAKDDQELQNQLYLLNKFIRELNHSDRKSPKFDLDIRKQSKRKGGTDEYYNFRLYKKDGIHPDTQLAKLWLRRISWKVIDQCFK